MEEIGFSTISRPVADASVVIRGAYKRYSKNVVVLKGLDLTVPEGTIYGLLGPSGCGKTTLLSSILGRTDLDAGSVELSVKRRSEIGYMPQNISLYDDLSIMENLLFFGYLFSMPKKKIEARATELISFLNIPSTNRLVHTLSGGQQRRVSIAVTFLHEPKLLILDEPTVGVDPILSHSIWEKLLEMSRKGKTIIITTHYIQEAQQSHAIGLMRGGKILAEDSPMALMEKYDCGNLEDVFLKAVLEEENQRIHKNDNSENNTSHWKKTDPVTVRYDDDDEMISKKKTWAILYKNTILMKRGYAFLLFSLLLPIIQTILFNITIGKKPIDLKLAIVNEEIAINDCNPHSYEGCLFESSNISLSCLVLEYIHQDKYKFVEYNTTEDAVADLKKKKVYGVLHFKQNYTDSLSEMIGTSIFIRHYEDVINGFVKVWVDNSNNLILEFIRYDIQRAIMSLLQNATLNCGKNPDIGQITGIKIEKPIRGDPNEDQNFYFTVALIGISAFVIPAFNTSLVYIQERVGGQVDRILSSGATVFEIILSQILTQFPIVSVQNVVVMVFSFIVFDNPLNGNPITLFCLLEVASFTGILAGISLATVTANITATASAGTGLNFILGITSGMFGVRESMHIILQYLSTVLPLTWTVEAIRKIANKGAAFTDNEVIKGYCITSLWGLLFVFILFYYAKYKKNMLISAK